MKVVEHIREYFKTSSLHIGKNLILNNFSIFGSPFIVTATTWNTNSYTIGTGFYVVNTFPAHLCDGCCGLNADTEVEVEVKALCFTLKILSDWKMNIKNIFSNNANLIEAVKRGNPHDAWRLNQELYNIMDFIAAMENPR